MTWIDETIEEGNAALFSGDIDEMEAFLKNATKRMAFEGVPEPKRGLNFFKYQATFFGFGNRHSTALTKPNEEDTKNDIHKILEKLDDWKEMMADPASKAGKHSIENHNVNINTNNVNALSDSSSSSSVQVDLSVTIEAIESSDLTEDQIKELKALMLDLSATKGKDSKTVAEKLKEALEIAKSSGEAAKAVLGFAVPVIQSIL